MRICARMEIVPNGWNGRDQWGRSQPPDEAVGSVTRQISGDPLSVVTALTEWLAPFVPLRYANGARWSEAIGAANLAVSMAIMRHAGGSIGLWRRGIVRVWRAGSPPPPAMSEVPGLTPRGRSVTFTAVDDLNTHRVDAAAYAFRALRREGQA